MSFAADILKHYAPTVDKPHDYPQSLLVHYAPKVRDAVNGCWLEPVSTLCGRPRRTNFNTRTNKRIVNCEHCLRLMGIKK